MVLLVERQGLTFEAAAAALNVAKPSHTWVARWRVAEAAERESLTCLEDRPSTPRRSPRLLSERDHDRVCEVRWRTGWGPRQIATEVDLAHSTVHRALTRRGLSRRALAARGDHPLRVALSRRPPAHGRQALRALHAPRPSKTGERWRSGKEKLMRIGYEFAHSVVDDHSRLAYTELHTDERAASVNAFFERALGFFRARSIEPRRVMTDNHLSYTRNRGLPELLARNDIRQLLIEVRRPQTNAKVERYQQTLKREWALGQRYRSSGSPCSSAATLA